MPRTKGSKAEAIRAILCKHPDATTAEITETLAKKGLETTPANIYDTKSRFEGKPRRKQKRAKASQETSLADQSVELAMLREQVRKLRAVVATLL